MKINCGIIVKDDSELELLQKAIQSVAPYVEGVYITANGKDVDEVEAYCKKYKELHYSYHTWNDDFSDQRNYNFSQMPQDSDFLFWMDADDVLYGGQHLQKIAELAKRNRQDVIFFTYWYGCRFDGEPSEKTLADIEMEHMRERLIRPGTVKWVGRLHETPVPVTGSRDAYTQVPYGEKQPIAIMHTAGVEYLQDKMDRNKRILQLQLKEETEKGKVDPRTELYLMKIYAEDPDESNLPKVIELGESYLKKSGWDEERGTANEQMAIATSRMGDERKGIDYLHAAIREWSAQPLYYVRLALAYYNVKNYKSSKHWLNVASSMDLDNKNGGPTNLKAMKMIYSEVLLKLSYNVDKDTKTAAKIAEKIYKEDPTKENKEQLLFMSDLNDLNEACHDAHKVAIYLKSIGREDSITKLLEALPDPITSQPMFQKMRQDVTPPRKWARNEICYFANFGAKHFEKWDANSLEKGIGGSETAVIQLSKEWTKLGYKVTVYGDPEKKGVYDGVSYLPWFYFNHRDYFNIFIQWRSWALSSQVKARKFYVDLHDVWSGVDITRSEIEHIDKIIVKSKYHRTFAPNIPDDKFLIISNGI